MAKAASGFLKSFLLIVLPALASAACIGLLLGLRMVEPLRIAIIAVGALSIILTTVAWRQRKARCPTCFRWNGLRVEQREVIGKKSISIKKNVTETKRDRKGSIVSTTHKEVFIPGERIFFRVHEVCRYCGQKFQREMNRDVESR